MLEHIKTKVEKLKKNEKEVTPQIEEIEAEREQKINEIKEEYQQKISAITSDIETFRNEVSNDLINSFIDAIMKEFDAKRSTSEYAVTEEIKQYRNSIATFEMFPTELVSELDKIISEEITIENVAYELEKIKQKYLKS
ncbi:MAG: hypothetical protein BAJALOKI1v1_510018 [Promethearchaeota archaeon]|nr:MAG: hypothetical protein BAJALOKI1v1_510018 [Candidatus Lokiarchaeota archaeon]